MEITIEYLRAHPDEVFVFGDNLLGYGKGGAAVTRDEPNAYGFVTKKAPNNNDASFYKPVEYVGVFVREYAKLRRKIEKTPQTTYLISRVGAGLANRYRIWEEIIEPRLKLGLSDLPNVRFLW